MLKVEISNCISLQMFGGHQGRGDVAVHEVELRGADRVQEGERGAPARERLQVEDQRGLPAGQSSHSHHLECDISEAAQELSEYGSLFCIIVFSEAFT